MRLEDATCVVRPWSSRDVESLIRHADNANVARQLRDRFPHPYTRANARAFLAQATAGGAGVFLAIEADGEAVGGIGWFRGGDVERFSAEVGYWLGEAYWGRGITTAALRLVSDYAFASDGLLRLFAVPFADNLASVRVLEKAGYQREGVLRSAAVKFGRPRDQLLYSRINPDWRHPLQS
jgi:RimJ/RimL family protein N-acetyltransferase